MCHDTCECVPLIVRQSCQADKLSPKGKANLCCVLLSLLSCLNAASACSSVQGTLTCGPCPGVAAAIPARLACRASCSRRHHATCAIASGLVASKSGKRSVQDSISLLPVS